MTSNLLPDAGAAGAAADPFLAKLRALRESLSRTQALRYRLEEMESRLLEIAANSTATE